jgi:hypothetical protein
MPRFAVPIEEMDALARVDGDNEGLRLDLHGQ